MATDAPILEGQRVAVTGRLLTLTSAELSRLVQEHGGQLQRTVNEQTTLLVIGQESLPVDREGRLKSNLRKARSRIQAGQAIDIRSEEELLGLLGLQTSQADIHRLYTTAQLEELLSIPCRKIDAWVRSGLISPAHSHLGIRYFEFAQVASARSLAELTSSGISLTRLKRSLRQLQQWTPARTSEALLGLAIHSRDGKVFVETEDGCLADASGQLQLMFSEAGEDNGEAALEPTLATVSLLEIDPQVDWLALGYAEEEQGEWERAEDAYRRGLEQNGDDGALRHNLGNVLYAQGMVEDAIEQWQIAMELDPNDAGCCNNAGVALAELERLEEAVTAFRRALRRDPNFSDASYNLADTLDEIGRTAEAATYYRQFLRRQSVGERDDYARMRLQTLDAS